MPDESINFVHKDKILQKVHSRRIFFIQSLSLFVLMGYGLVLISAFSLLAIMKYQITATKKSIDSKIEVIDKLKPIESKYLLLKQKTSSAYTMTSSLYQYQNLIQALFQIIPAGLLIDGFNLNENDQIEFSATTNNPADIEEFILNVKQYNGLQADKEIEIADIASISVNDEGEYNVAIKLKVNFL